MCREQEGRGCLRGKALPSCLPSFRAWEQGDPPACTSRPRSLTMDPLPLPRLSRSPRASGACGEELRLSGTHWGAGADGGDPARRSPAHCTGVITQGCHGPHLTVLRGPQGGVPAAFPVNIPQVSPYSGPHTHTHHTCSHTHMLTHTDAHAKCTHKSSSWQCPLVAAAVTLLKGDSHTLTTPGLLCRNPRCSGLGKSFSPFTEGDVTWPRSHSR